MKTLEGVRRLDMRSAKPRRKTADPFYYSWDWLHLVAVLKERRFGSPGNARCQHPQCSTPWRRGVRLFADHVHEIKDGGARLDPANVMFLCASCHTKKTN